MATAVYTGSKGIGGAFLIEDAVPAGVFTPEDMTEEHLAIARSAHEFVDKEVRPKSDEMQHGNFDIAVDLMRKAAALGLEGVLTPEQYGGMEMDLTSALIVAEQLGREGSFAGWHGAHAGIGTLPLLLFGTEAQKQKYLPKLTTCEWIASYCLTEPHAGSDALAAKTRADLSADGTHYVLNGQKMWITNAGKADVFTVFAKIGGEQFSAFLVERAYAGVSVGPEEKKMGIKGSSTAPVFFDNVQVPVENLLGEAGRGHIIAFNILNVGRLKLGAFAIGGSKGVLQTSIAYAQNRKAFGTSIANFGVIRHKLAEMAIRIYAAESMTWRVDGMIAGNLQDFSWSQPDAAQRMMKAVEEFAAECSIIKVYASEALDYVVDEGVQIHGGYGYHQDYEVERAYRDSRINRIFEGTNEINRLLTTGMLLKRAQQGRLGLVKAAKGVMAEILAGPQTAEESTEERRLLKNAKKIALLLLALAFDKFGAEMEKQQEVLSAIADVLMETFAMESALLRCEKTGKTEGQAADMTAVLLRDSMARIDAFARPVLAACAEGDALRANMAVLRRFAKYEPVDSIALRRKICDLPRGNGPVRDLVTPRLVVAVGLPGSGKSTYLAELGVNPISSDALRLQLVDDTADQTIHGRVFETARFLARQRLELGRPATYIDATNLTRRDRQPFLELARECGASVEALYFDVPVEICEARNALRARVVPAEALRAMAAKLEPPTVEEGFGRVEVVSNF